MAIKEEASEEAFPCPVEFEVASALLLLSFTTTAKPSSRLLSPPPPLRRNESKKKKKKRKRLVKKSPMRLSLSGSSSSSTVKSDNKKQLKMTPVFPMFHHTVALKVVRKQRSKIFCISDSKKSSSGIAEIKGEDSSTVTAASSCVSNGCSSAISTTGSSSEVMLRRRGLCEPARRSKDPYRKPVLASGHMGRRAEAIIKFLSSHGCASEVKIRQLLGDNPSTSKALRVLLKMEKVTRSGGGGRTDPYVYMIP